MAYIDADAFIEDIKTEVMNLYLDGMKGTPRPYKELYDIIDRIKEQPTADVVEVETIKAWLYSIAINNVGCNLDGDFSVACEEIISRLDGLRRFTKERSRKE